MTQRDKVKELVGKGLHSYHTKALQQIDRIEKKNKEQNHKISILTNELDNDYLTKTEEGSVVSLEHSKEGMVYLNELQGNTLVNYCTDGSKEMTLNGDIDVEGVSVTTNEGADKGLVDVMCEGHTLVNLWSGKMGTSSNVLSTTSMVYTPDINKTYTLIFKKLLQHQINVGMIWNDNTTGNDYCFSSKEDSLGLIKKTIKLSTFEGKVLSNIRIYSTSSDTFTTIQDVIILEGDYTNKPIPTGYFEGMKSVGQDDENGHKIEILSKNKNLCIVNSYSGKYHNKIETNIPCKKNTNYTLTFKDESDSSQAGTRGITLITHKTKIEKSNSHGDIYIHGENEGGKQHAFLSDGYTFNTLDCCYISVTSNNMTGIPNVIFKEIQIEEGTQATSYAPHTSNKKEIILNEPLRGLPNGVKDRFVKIDGKWFIERNCVAITLDETYKWAFNNTEGTTTNRYILDLRPILPTLSIGQNVDNTLCDKGITCKWNQTVELGVSRTDGSLFVYNKSCATLAEFKNWITNNNLNLVMKLATPIYEPLEVEPVLKTYNNVTHISNDSTIPCTMRIKNSGYNVIIKPSTLYTVTLDTNKSGTIGINLGGVKGTTTNSVLKLTTPTILTDDSLRLYGKDIKGSKVRLLEGDKTNWIPSHFEGIKSSFEDKFDSSDNTYKMEILSNNENIINVPNMSCVSSFNGGWWNLEGTDNSMYNNIDKKTNLYFYAEKNKNYIVTFDSKNLALPQRLKYQNQEMIVSCQTLSSVNGSYKIRVKGDGILSTFRFRAKLEDGKTPMEITNFMIVEETLYSDEFIKNKHNKIQFSSIEPLRSVDNVKDRFVFKDGKLMIERVCGELVIDSSNSFTRASKYDKDDCYGFERDYSEIKVNYSNKVIIKCANLPFTPYLSDAGNKNFSDEWISTWSNNSTRTVVMLKLSAKRLNGNTLSDLDIYLRNNPIKIIYIKSKPTYEEISFELQKIILEGYENGTLFFDTNIPPTSTITYAGATPIASAIKTNELDIVSNTQDINDNIIPYLMDMDYRVVCLELAGVTQGVSMTRLFGGAFEMLQRDIQSKRYSMEEYRHRLDVYLGTGKITEDEFNKLGDMFNE